MTRVRRLGQAFLVSLPLLACGQTDGPTGIDAQAAATLVEPAGTAIYTAECGYMWCLFDETTYPESVPHSCAWVVAGVEVNGCQFYFFFSSEGEKAVALTVVTESGATATATGTVVARTSPIHLEAQHARVRGGHTVTLSWTGAVTDSVLIRRTGGDPNKIQNPLERRIANAGTFVDLLGKTNQSSFVYSVREIGGVEYSLPLSISW